MPLCLIPAGGGRRKAAALGALLRRCPGLQSQVRKDLLDHRLFLDRRDDLQLAAAVRAVLQVEVESEASAQTNLYSSSDILISEEVCLALQTSV